MIRFRMPTAELSNWGGDPCGEVPLAERQELFYRGLESHSRERLSNAGESLPRLAF